MCVQRGRKLKILYNINKLKKKTCCVFLDCKHASGFEEQTADGRQTTHKFTGRRVSCYLVEGAHCGLENQGGVEKEGAQQGLGVGSQLGQDARQQQVDVERVGQHVLHARQQHAHKGACRDKCHFLCKPHLVFFILSL